MAKRMSKRAKRIAEGAGVGVLTAAALAAGAAYLLSDKKRQRKMKAWAVKARREVAKNVRTAQRMSEGEYKRVVDRATKRYGALHNVNAREAIKVARDMKEEWSRLRKNAQKLAAMAKEARKPGKPRRAKKAAPRRKARRARR